VFRVLRSKIRNKIIALPVVIVTFLSLGCMIYFPTSKKSEMIELAAQQATAAANLLAFGFGVALDADKFEAIGEGFNQAKAMGNISYVIIFDSKDNFLSAYNPDSLELETKRNGFKSEPQVSNGFIEKASPIKFMNSSYGTIVVGLSLKEVQKATIATLYVISFGAFSALTISVLISIIIAAKIVSG